LYNVSLCNRLNSTRWEAFYGSLPGLENVHTFGSKVYARVHDEQRKNLDPKSQVGIYLGPEQQGPGYKVLTYNPQLKRDKYQVHIVRDMVTFETLKAVTGARDESQLHWGGGISHYQTPIRWPPTPTSSL